MNRLTKISIGLSIVLCVVLVYIGLSLNMPWSAILPWTSAGLNNYIIFMIVCAVLIMAGSLLSKTNHLLVGFILGVGFALLSGNLWPLFIALWFFVSSILFGRFILTIFRIKSYEDNWLICFLVGSGIYGTIVGLIAHFPINYPGLYGTALALPIMFSWRTFLNEIKKLLNKTKQKDLSTPFDIRILDLAIAVVALVYFIISLMPELGADALATHLFIPAHLAFRHQWGFDATTYVWATLPLLGDWIFSIGYMLGGETGARMINVIFILVLGCLVREFVLWASNKTHGTKWASARGAKWATLIFLSTPLTFAIGSSLYIDSIWTAFTVGGAFVVFDFCLNSDNTKSGIPLAGLLLGLSLQAKSAGFFILPIFLLVMIIHYKSWYKVGIYYISIGLSIFIILSSIPYITAWFLTGNPIFPFLNAVFKSPYYPSSSNFNATQTVYGQGVTWDILYKWTFDPSKYFGATIGAPGFQWLLLFLPVGLILFIKKQYRGIILFLVSTLIIVSVFQVTSYLRYVFPAWVLFSAAIGFALSLGNLNFINRFLFFIVTCIVIILNLLFLQAGSNYRNFPLRIIFNENSRRQYLTNTLPIRNAVELVNQLNTSDSPVAVFGAPSAAGLMVDALYPSWYNWGFQKDIISIQTEQDAIDVFSKRDVTYIILASNWLGTNCLPDEGVRQKLIENVTETIKQFNHITVRKVNKSKLSNNNSNDVVFDTELLTNPYFVSSDGWFLSNGVEYDSITGIISSSVNSPATQVIPVTPDSKYQNIVEARSLKDGVQGRIQINWFNAEGKMISTNIEVFDCTPNWVKHTMEIVSPEKATGAMVYVCSHSEVPVEFKSCSLLSARLSN